MARLAAKFGPKGTPAAGQHQLFGTTEGNAIVAPIHSKAMPVILTTPAECDPWLEQDRIVRKLEKEDGVAAALF